MVLQLKPYFNTGTLTHFVAFEEGMADKRLPKPSRSLLKLAILCVLMWHEENQLRFSNNSKHFRFYWTTETFHFRIIFH